MTEEILVNAALGEVRIAVVAGGRLRELLIERPEHQSILGSVFLGRVERVVPGVNAAFVDIGLERAGFLGAWEALSPADRRARGTGTSPPIGDTVHEGETVLVQAVKDPIAGKGARLSRQISFAGRHLVFAPEDEGIKISRRIQDESVRERIAAEVEAACNEAGAAGGFIVRTAAAEAGRDELAGDIRALSELWAKLTAARDETDPPRCLHNDLGPVERALRDLVTGSTTRIVFDSGDTLASAKAYCEIHFPEAVERLEHHSAAGNLFGLHGIEDDIDTALAPRVDLPSGGRIVIQETEALTAVDVNSARAGAGEGQPATALATNLEAVAEAARQIRLRNIGGLVVIDLIHMDPADRGQVVDAFRDAVAPDRAPIQIGEISQFGLIEMTRKRTRDPLRAQLGEACATCDGEGWRISVESIAHEILREAEQEARAGAPAGAGKPVIDIFAAPDVAAFLLGDGEDLLNALEGRTGIEVEVRADGELERDAYDIEVQAHE